MPPHLIDAREVTGVVPDTFHGRVVHHEVDSLALRGNPLNDPTTRPLFVQLPPSYDRAAHRRFPTIYLLQGFTGRAPAWFYRPPFSPTFPEMIDQKMAAGEIPPCILVYLDGFTRYGGSQFVDSPGTGRYHTHVTEELVPFVDSRYRTLPEAAHRGLSGHSSGGFGSIVTTMLRPDLFGAFACHAGDGLYEANYRRDFPQAARDLQPYAGDIMAWHADFAGRNRADQATDGVLLLMLGLSSCFSADDDGTIQLPFETQLGQVRERVWEKWLAWDPVRMIADHSSALLKCRAIWLDAGRRDEYYLDLAAQAMANELARVGVTEQLGDRMHFEIHDGSHFTGDTRFPLGLRFLAENLSE